MTGRHLHNQIVVPLIVAAVLVGSVATVLAVVALSRLMDTWIDSTTQAVAENMELRVRAEGESLERFVRYASQSPRLEAALRSGDVAGITALLTSTRVSARADTVMLLDSRKRVVVSTGLAGAARGAKPLTLDTWPSDGASHARLVSLGGAPALAALAPVKPPRASYGSYTLVVSERIDERFVGGIVRDSKALLYLFDASGRPLVTSVGTIARTDAEVEEALRPGVLAAIRSGQAGSGTFERAGGSYRLAVLPLRFADDAAIDAYLAAAVGTDIAIDTRITTTALIFMWSLIAVVVLVVLGLAVARNVSRPLLELTAGARKVAEGDFDTKVEIVGENELADLAESFNAMTRSLRDRSGTLTKKMLELSTMYEMSRALGSTLEMDVLLESVLDSSLRIFDVELGYVTLRDRETGVLSIRALRIGSEGAASASSSMAEWVVREGRPLIFNPSNSAAERADAVTGACAALCVPLMSGDGVVGAVMVGSSDPSFRFSSDDVRLLSTMANHVTIAVGNIELFSSLQDAYLATVRSLATAVDAKDSYTRGHSESVALYAMLIGDRLGLSAEQKTALEVAAYLHDIGKIGIREEILLKPGRLDDDEYVQMKHHPLIGANILRPVAFPWPIAPVVRHHHEHFDGSGYPAGLRGEEIPLLARILTVADAYDAMVSDRPYRRGRKKAEAIDELVRCRGSHFDPKVVDAFVAALEAEDRAAMRHSGIEEVQPEEARAVLVAVCTGMFAAFRRLGGPRLASNLEAELAEYLRTESLPYSFKNGYLSVEHEGERAAAVELAQMRRVITHLSVLMERTAGRSLVDHFYAETLDGLSERLASIAAVLELYPAAA